MYRVLSTGSKRMMRDPDRETRRRRSSDDSSDEHCKNKTKDYDSLVLDVTLDVAYLVLLLVLLILVISY